MGDDVTILFGGLAALCMIFVAADCVWGESLADLMRLIRLIAIATLGLVYLGVIAAVVFKVLTLLF